MAGRKTLVPTSFDCPIPFLFTYIPFASSWKGVANPTVFVWFLVLSGNGDWPPALSLQRGAGGVGRCCACWWFLVQNYLFLPRHFSSSSGYSSLLSRAVESPHPRTLAAMLVITSGKCRAALFHLDVDTVVPLLLPALTSVVPHCFTSLRRLLLNALWFGLVTLVWFGLVGFCCQDSLALLSSCCAHVPGAHDWP